MKKLVTGIFLLSIVTFVTACGNQPASQSSSGSSSKQEAKTQEAPKKEEEQKEAQKKEETPEAPSQDPGLSVKDAPSGSASQDPSPADPFPSEKVDVDLTASSSTMAFSQVYQMMVAPKEYAGKRVKMRGTFSASQRPSKDSYYFAVTVADAAACCVQGLEFVLEEPRRYPEEYPKQGETVTVVGEFQTYTESGRIYCHLVHAKMAP